jgi:hypothetical protein
VADFVHNYLESEEKIRAMKQLLQKDTKGDTTKAIFHCLNSRLPAPESAYLNRICTYIEETGLWNVMSASLLPERRIEGHRYKGNIFWYRYIFIPLFMAYRPAMPQECYKSLDIHRHEKLRKWGFVFWGKKRITRMESKGTLPGVF